MVIELSLYIMNEM